MSRIDSKEREPFHWQTAIGYKTVPQIVMRGYDTSELVEGGYSFCDFIFVLFQGRIPTEKEEKMLDYLMLLSFESGVTLPAAATHLTAAGRALLTSAIGAGILCFGQVYGAYNVYGHMMRDYLLRAEKEGKSVEEMAEILVREYLEKEESIPGLQQPKQKRLDPRVYPILRKSEELKTASLYHDFQLAIVTANEKITGQKLHPDVIGSSGSTFMDLGFSPLTTWGIVMIAQSFGLGAHAIEEMMTQPPEVLRLTLQPQKAFDLSNIEYIGPSKIPVPSKEEGRKKAKSFSEILESVGGIRNINKIKYNSGMDKWKTGWKSPTD